MGAVNWEYWSELGSGFVGAILLLVTGDPETWTIVRQSLFISITASVASIIPGVPIGAWVAVSSFPGRNLLMTAFNTGFGLPPVVVGLILSILLLRHGPLGGLNLRFTPTAMIIAQFILCLPIVINLTAVAVQQLNPKLRLQMRALGRHVGSSCGCSGGKSACRCSVPTWRRSALWCMRSALARWSAATFLDRPEC